MGEIDPILIGVNIKSVLDEALLLQSEISKLKRPNKRVLDAYRLWFKKPFPALGGLSKNFLDIPEDLAGLNTSETDYLSLFLRHHWPSRVSRPTRAL